VHKLVQIKSIHSWVSCCRAYGYSVASTLFTHRITSDPFALNLQYFRNLQTSSISQAWNLINIRTLWSRKRMHTLTFWNYGTSPEARLFLKISERACFNTECFRKVLHQSKTKRAGAENIAQRGISEHFVSSKLLW